MKTIFVLLARLIAIWFRTDKNNLMEQFLWFSFHKIHICQNIFPFNENQFTALYAGFLFVFELSISHTSSRKSFSHKCIILQLLLVHCEKNFCRKSLGNIMGQLFWNVSFLSFIIISLIRYNEVIKSSLWSFEEYSKRFSRLFDKLYS